MIIEDFVMLGRTVPEPDSEGNEGICSAGWSEQHGPIRIHPLERNWNVPRWSMVRISVEKNRRDYRPASYTPSRFKGRIFETVKKRVDIATQKRIVEKLRVRSIDQANEEKRSLCIILPASVPQMHFKKGDEPKPLPPADLLGERRILPAKQRFDYLPRLKFKDEDGKEWNMQLRDWGCYELIRKRGMNYAIHMLSEALNISTAGPLFCGNILQYPNRWLVIGMFTSAAHARPDVGEAA